MLKRLKEILLLVIETVADQFFSPSREPGLNPGSAE